VTQITKQLVCLQRRVDSAAQSAGRDPKSVRILAVSKKQPIEALMAACAAGLRHFGENYLQEALDKIQAVDGDAVWHFIGPIQSNKTRPIAEHFDWVHTVTSSRIAERLSAQHPVDRPALNVCIQLRPHGADDRNGVTEDDLPGLAAVIAGAPKLRFRGLMTIPLADCGAAATRSEFARARRLLEELGRAGYAVDTLSMGMSADLEAAIMEGSTCIRIGTDLFGSRDYG
jgi:pyridoxal phosphate enzyme (YggS family)